MLLIVVYAEILLVKLDLFSVHIIRKIYDFIIEMFMLNSCSNLNEIEDKWELIG